MTRIIGIAGSLRQGSYNAALLRNAVELAPAGCSLEIATIKDIPLYDGDLETRSGIPAAVAALKDIVAGADGKGTAGCTAMDETALKAVMQWLDPTKAPVLVQLPTTALAALRTAWALPELVAPR